MRLLRIVGAFAVMVTLVASLSACGEEAASPERTKTPVIEPTKTPVVEATGTPSGESGLPRISDAECAYLEDFASQGVNVQQASEKLVELWEEPPPSDPDWRGNVEEQLSVLSLAEERARALSPPDSLADLHDDWLAITISWGTVSAVFGEALEDPDTVDWERAAGPMVESLVLQEDTARKVGEFVSTRSGSCD